MKRHHIVGIFGGICAIGLTARSALSGDIVEAITYFIVLSIITISTFFKDRLTPRWSHRILPFWTCLVVICLLLFELAFAFYSLS